MSVVLAVCGSNFFMMMSDSRLTEYRSNGKLRVANEDFKKVFKINDNVIVGISGDALAGCEVIKELDQYQTEFLTLEKVSSILLDKAKTCSFPNLGLKILIGGRNRRNEFVLQVMDSKNDFIPHIDIPKGNSFSIQSALPEANLNAYVEKNIFNTMPWITPENLFEHMRNCIGDIAEVNKTVNKKIQGYLVK